MDRHSRASRWVSHHTPRFESKVRLFCFPYAGGGASLFKNWGNCVPSEIEVCPIQLPGRESRITEPPFAHLADLLQALVPIMLPLLDDMPFAFFGHSMGGRLSFELARHLRREHLKEPIHLFISACAAPTMPRLDLKFDQLSDSEFIEYIRQMKGTPEAILQNNELMHVLLPRLRADFALFESYRPSHQAPFDCPITIFGGLHDQTPPPSHVEEWYIQTTNAFQLHWFQSDHFFIHSDHDALLKIITEELLQTSDKYHDICPI